MPFVGFTPNWEDDEDAEDSIRRLVTPHLHTPCLGVAGVVSPSGWQPQHPLVLRFAGGAIGITTEMSEVWSITQWGDHTFEAGPDEAQQQMAPLAEILELDPIVGAKLTGVDVADPASESDLAAWRFHFGRWGWGLVLYERDGLLSMAVHPMGDAQNKVWRSVLPK